MAKRFNLSDYAYAHRGLWRVEGPPENSLEALLYAAELGFGIEFDVRPASDGVPVIFHDLLLERMTGYKGYVSSKSSLELEQISLIGSGQIITLETLLRHWPAQTPLLCEIKIDGDTDPSTFARTVSDLLVQYEGPAAAMSFSTEAVAALPKALMRGQLISPSEMTGDTNLADTATVEVDYFACHVSDAANATLQFARKTKPLITWTVKDAETCEALAPLTDSQIFEGFDPALAKRLILNK